MSGGWNYVREEGTLASPLRPEARDSFEPADLTGDSDWTPNTNSLTQLDSMTMSIPKSWGYRWRGVLKREGSLGGKWRQIGRNSG